MIKVVTHADYKNKEGLILIFILVRLLVSLTIMVVLKSFNKRANGLEKPDFGKCNSCPDKLKNNTDPSNKPLG